MRDKWKLNWLNDYLDNRRQFVEIGGHKSDTKSNDFGVPQGSHLGPRLFGIKVTDLPDAQIMAQLNCLLMIQKAIVLETAQIKLLLACKRSYWIFICGAETMD